MIQCNTDNFDTISGTFATQRLQHRDLPPARLAPGGPEIHEQQLPVILREPMQDPVRCGQGDIR
jgi:hypothetical protein